MTVFELILISLGIVVAAVLIICLLIKRIHDDAKIKWALIFLTGVIAVVAISLMITLRKASAMSHQIISETVEAAESYIGAENLNEPIDATDIKEIIAGYRKVETCISDNEEIGWIISALVSHSLLNSISSVTDHTDTLIRTFESSGTELTGHNVIAYTAFNANQMIERTLLKWQWAIAILTLIADILTVILCACARKGWLTSKTSSITFGNDV